MLYSTHCTHTDVIFQVKKYFLHSLQKWRIRGKKLTFLTAWQIEIDNILTIEQRINYLV